MRDYTLYYIKLTEETEKPDGEPSRRIASEPVSFHVIRQIGEGSTGLVYHARSASGNDVIIKECCPKVLRQFACWDGDGLRMEFGDGLQAFVLKELYRIQKKEFEREYLLQRQLQANNLLSGSNNPELYAGGPDRIPYIVMNCDGAPVTIEELKRYQLGCARRNLDYVNMILGALRPYAAEIARIHDQGYLLLDIKPQNLVMTAGEGGLSYRRIIDYGSARKLDHVRSTDDSINLSTTHGYMAPELAERRYAQVGPASDIYSFGMTVIGLLAGRVADPIHLLELDGESFERNIRFMASEAGFTAIQAKDAAFFRRLKLFAALTLSRDIVPTHTPFDVETLAAQPGRQRGLRLDRMEDVISLLSWLMGEGEYQYGELLLSSVWEKAEQQAREFRDASYGVLEEQEFNRALFSPALLPKLTHPEAAQAAAIDLDTHGYLEAESGAGKTVLLKYLYAQCAQEAGRYLPVWISAVRAVKDPGGQDQRNILRGALRRGLFGEAGDHRQRQAHEAQLSRWMTGGSGAPRILALVDGLNEISWYRRMPELKQELRWLMEQGNVTVLITGHNRAREFPEYTGPVFHISPLDPARVRDYLDSVLPLWREDEPVRERIGKMIPTLTTPLLLHYFCAPLLELPEIPADAVPENPGQIMESYLFRMDYSIQNRIHRHVSEYPGQVRPPCGAFLLRRVISRVCSQMAVRDEMYVTRETLEQTIRSALTYSARGTPMIDGTPLRPKLYEKIMSLSWCSYLFEYRGGLFYIHHESYRDFLAAAQLAADPYGEIWLYRIPRRVAAYLVHLLPAAEILQMRKRLMRAYRRMKRFGFFGMEFRRGEVVSEFFIEDFQLAGMNLRELIAAHPGLSRWQKWRRRLFLPREILKKRNRGPDETDRALSRFDDLCRTAADWMEDRGLPGSQARSVTAVLLGGPVLEPQLDRDEYLRWAAGYAGIPRPEVLLELEAILRGQLGQMAAITEQEPLRETIAAVLFLEETEQCNQRGQPDPRLEKPLERSLLGRIGRVAGICSDAGEFNFMPGRLFEVLLSRKYILFKGYEERLEWNTEAFYAMDKGMTYHDQEEMIRQTGILCLLKQFVIREYRVYKTQECVAGAADMTAFAQLSVLLHERICDGSLAVMLRYEWALSFQKGMLKTDCAVCDSRDDLAAACVRLTSCEGISLRRFLRLLGICLCGPAKGRLKKIRPGLKLAGLCLLLWSGGSILYTMVVRRLILEGITLLGQALLAFLVFVGMLRLWQCVEIIVIYAADLLVCRLLDPFATTIVNWIRKRKT